MHVIQERRIAAHSIETGVEEVSSESNTMSALLISFGSDHLFNGDDDDLQGDSQCQSLESNFSTRQGGNLPWTIKDRIGSVAKTRPATGKGHQGSKDECAIVLNDIGRAP